MPVRRIEPSYRGPSRLCEAAGPSTEESTPGDRLAQKEAPCKRCCAKEAMGSGEGRKVKVAMLARHNHATL
jgi:hypothetical protein